MSEPIDPVRGSPEPTSRETELLWRYLDLINAGQAVNPDEILREHPEAGPEIIRQLEAFQRLTSPAESVGPLGVLGDYTLRRQIGRGGMGVVYEAWETSMDRRVALKVLPPGVAADERALQRFVREAKTAGQLRHPNVVGVYSTGVREGTPWYAMEFVDGETLAQLLVRLKTADPEAETPFGKKDSVVYFGKLAEVFADVADGLHHAHSRGIIHRDIKPSNLILDGEGRLRILDFGLARLEGQESLTISGDVVGTPLYMSPEQARRKKIPVDHRTDVYSLGATLYEMIALQPPFRGADNQETLSQIVERDPVEPRRVNQRAPKDLETIVLKCLRKDPGDRYGTAEALGQDLRRFVRGEVIEARAETGWARTSRRLWRARMRLGVTALIGLLLILGAVLGAVLWNREREATLARYEELVGNAIDGLEVGLLTSPGEFDEGETIALGILHPYDVQSRVSSGMTTIEQAVVTLRAAVALLPDRPEARVHLSRALWAVCEPAEAERVLDAALERESGFVPALLLKAHRLREAKKADLADALDKVLDVAADEPWERTLIQAHRASRRGEWDIVDNCYTELLNGAARPFAAFEKELRLKRGRVALKRGQHLRAQRDFSFVRESSRGALGPALLLGAAYYLADQNEEAAAVLSEALSETSSAEADIAVSDLYWHFGDLKRAREAVELIQEERVKLAARVGFLLAEGKPEEAVQSGKKALAMGLQDPWVYRAVADAIRCTGRLEEAKQLLAVALARYPEDRGINDFYQTILYYLCDYDEEIAYCENRRRHMGEAVGLGWAYFRKGQLTQAVAEFTREIERYPREGAAYLGRSVSHWFLKDYALSVADTVRQVAVDPGRYSGSALCREYSVETRPLFAPHWVDLEQAAAAAVQRGIAVPRYLGFRALANIFGPNKDPERALELAREAVGKAEDQEQFLPEAFSYLAEVQAERGEVAEAIRTLEQATELPRCRLSAAQNLVRLRGQLLPQVASCRSVEDLMQHETDYAAQASNVDDAMLEPQPLREYLRILKTESTGNVDLATRDLADLVASGPPVDDLTATLRLAALKANTGSVEEALSLLEEKAQENNRVPMSLWAEWLHIASRISTKGSSNCPARLQSLIGRLAPQPERSPAREVLWAVERLETTGVIRINCGGNDAKDVGGQDWSQDRFFAGGDPYDATRPPLKTRENPELLYPHREYWEGFWASPGYCIPVPDGHYALTLTFCMTSPRPRPMQFGIEVEGILVTKPFDPIAEHGFAVPFEEQYEVIVTDGALNVTFTSIRTEASVNAIEVRRIGDNR